MGGKLKRTNVAMPAVATAQAPPTASALPGTALAMLSQNSGPGTGAAWLLGGCLAVGFCTLCFFGGYATALYSSRAQYLSVVRWGSISVNVAQYSLAILLLRYYGVSAEPCKTGGGSFEVLVCYAELLKLLFCVAALGVVRLVAPETAASGSGRDDSHATRRLGLSFLAVPALCYAVQNNLSYVAGLHLSAINLDMIDRTRLIFTAMLGAGMLGRTLQPMQWLMLGAIALGAYLAADHSEQSGGLRSADAIGVMAALGRAFLSSFNSVYLEAVLKADRTRLLERNVQMCVFAIPTQLCFIAARGKLGDMFDVSAICRPAALIVLNFTFAGLLTSVVTRYADSNLKNLAQSVGTLITAALAAPLFGFAPGPGFALGCPLVLVASAAYVYLSYAAPDQCAPVKPARTGGHMELSKGGSALSLRASLEGGGGQLDEHSTAFLELLLDMRRKSAIASMPPKVLRWVWPKELDGAVLLKHLDDSTTAGIFTNHGPGAKKLEAEAKVRFHIANHAVVACASGTAALHALLAVHIMKGRSTAGGILVSAFGFPPILQANWRDLARMVDIDPVHAGPKLPAAGEPVPSIICIVNPFGYYVDVAYYRRYCDEHGIPLWMDNASSPLVVLPDGSYVHDLAEGVGISLHETKPLGRGEGGLMLVPLADEPLARCAVNFGYDVRLPPEARKYHVEGNNWRMSDFQAAAILMHWELHWEDIAEYMVLHDAEVRDAGPFRRGARGTIFSCLMEPRQPYPEPNVDIKYYYKPMLDQDRAPESWNAYNSLQCRPFHPGPGVEGGIAGDVPSPPTKR